MLTKTLQSGFQAVSACFEWNIAPVLTAIESPIFNGKVRFFSAAVCKFLKAISKLTSVACLQIRAKNMRCETALQIDQCNTRAKLTDSRTYSVTHSLTRGSQEKWGKSKIRISQLKARYLAFLILGSKIIGAWLGSQASICPLYIQSSSRLRRSQQRRQFCWSQPRAKLIPPLTKWSAPITRQGKLPGPTTLLNQAASPESTCTPWSLSQSTRFKSSQSNFPIRLGCGSTKLHLKQSGVRNYLTLHLFRISLVPHSRWLTCNLTKIGIRLMAMFLRRSFWNFMSVWLAI